MYCWQCEQTAKGTGCTSFGVCGKDPDTAQLQDLLVHVTKGISMYATRAWELGIKDEKVNHYVLEALFTTVTNVNFDPERVASLVRSGVEARSKMRTAYEAACHDRGVEPDTMYGPAVFEFAHDIDEMVRQGAEVNFENRFSKLGKDATALQELTLYGIKGMAAYADHAWILGMEDESIYEYIYRALDVMCRPEQSADELQALSLECGKVNLRTMELLDEANTGTYGHPEPTQVRVTPVKGKCILVSGHDLKDLKEILQLTEGTGINVYTHGEMLPCHGYPELNKYPHLVGNYGGAWQDQRKEFDEFPGAILMTTNCIQKPAESYKGRIFTTGLVAWPGVEHVNRNEFNKVVDAAKEEPGFSEDAPEHNIMVGFGHNAVMGVADKVIEAVKGGDIRHFFLIGGCDGAKSGRNYYTELAQMVPDDCVILTLACGKYRFNKLEFGDIGGIPRLLDVGQCNDAYSAIKIASALADAFDTDVNSLPLSLVVSWYEQKAVCILLTLLYLGIKDMRLGPTLPAFVTPNILDVLVEKFDIKPISSPSEDLKAMLA